MSSTAELRAELRGWLRTNVTPEVVNAGGGLADASTLPVLRAWNERLADARWAAPAWPSSVGGRDAGVDEQIAYLEEMSAARAPGPLNAIGVANIAPAIMAFGTEAQQARFLGPMLRGAEVWSQAMSEPDAGSDLASLRTSAVAAGDGEHFVVNGHKTWNSLGHLADWCQLYARTDPSAKKHQGISCFLVDMRTSGIEAIPLRTITGDHDFAEVFLTGVRVPRSALLGELNQGWQVAMTTLSFERAGVARLHLGLATKLGDLLDDPRARETIGDPAVRQRVARIHSELACMRWTTERALAEPALFGGAGGSLSKLSWARCEQALADLAIDMLGLTALNGPDGRWTHNLMSSRAASIAGGTTEINRNIVGEHLLGLPRERY